MYNIIYILGDCYKPEFVRQKEAKAQKFFEWKSLKWTTKITTVTLGSLIPPFQLLKFYLIILFI